MFATPDFEMAYYTSKNGSGKDAAFFPMNVGLDEPMTAFDSREYDRFVFLALCPKSDTSPFKDRGEPFWGVYSPARVAEGRKAAATARVRVQTEIMQLKDDAAIALASSLVVAGGRLGPDAYETADLARISLADWLIANPPAFIAAWDDQTMRLRALIELAARTGIISSTDPSAGGRKQWEWGINASKSGSICLIRPNEEPIAALLNRCADDDFYSNFIPVLAKEVQVDVFGSGEEPMSEAQQAKAEAHSLPEKTVAYPFEEEINRLIVAGRVAIDPDTLALHKVEDGVAKGIIFTPTTDDWAREWSAIASKDNAKRMQLLAMSRPLK